MESFKERLVLLEERTKTLEVNLCKSHETDSEIHLSSIDKEQGVIPLNEFDTFRFVRAENWIMPEFTKSDGNWKHGMVSNATIYFLTNPSQEIKELVELSVGQKINFSKYIICFKYYDEKTTFESMITNKKLTEFYLFWYQGGPCYGTVSIIQPLYSAFNNKPFEIEDLPKQKLDKNTSYDLILYDFIREMNFKANLTIDFKNPYKLIPHISFFLTPLDIKSLIVSLKSLSPQQAVFELKYGKDCVPITTQFHWLVTGSV